MNILNALNLLSNAAIWFASRSKYDWKDNGRPIGSDACNQVFASDYLNNPLRMGQIMREENIPFDVLPSKKLAGYNGRLLVVSNVINIRDEEMDAIENFVKNGGNLYISGHIGNPRLLTLMEAESGGMTEHNVTYMNPTENGKRFFHDFNARSPMAVQSKQEILRLHGEYELLATITLPYTMTDKKVFASIHSNPPGIHTDMPAAILKNVGNGQILWVAAPIESSRPYMSRKAVGRMVRDLCGELPFSSNAPAFVEVIGWDKDGKRYFAAINQQETAPIAPMTGIEITLPYVIKNAKMAETGENLPVRTEYGSSVIQLPILNIFQIVTVE